MLTNFQNSFTFRLTGKFATNSYLNIPPHLKTCRYTTLWNIYVQKITVLKEKVKQTVMQDLATQTLF